MIGQTFLHYRIESKLGEGGMGVVYKARDIHLDRFVALKVLPSEKAANPERKRRFVQEAKAASALSHPNITHIYDIDQADGVEFIAMEYVEGRTLDELIGQKGLRVREVLRYAVQIADGLAAAHAAGIVHRDVKPGNIMVNEKSQVKILDFGLAKLSQPEEGDYSGSTQTMRPRTEEGAILGTVAYMSPEQAEGKKIDARSDIFSFGSVLYAMLTGQPAFRGGTKISTLSAIISKEPRPVSEIVETVPLELEKIITRCLRKEPERRIQHIGDLKLVLQELAEESEAGRLPRERQVAKTSVYRWTMGISIVAGLALVAVGLALNWRIVRSARPAPTTTLTRLTSDPGLTTDPALSPDGKLLAYASDRGGEGNLDIWVRQVDGGEPIQLTRDPTDDHEPAFAPDGRRIVFRSEREGGGIYVISTLGGEARKIAPLGRRPKFSPDGYWVSYWVGHIGSTIWERGTSEIFVVASTGGQPRPFQRDLAAASYPIWLSDGEHLLFLANGNDKLPAAEGIDWWVATLNGEKAVKTGASAAFAAKNLAIVVSESGSAIVPSQWVAEDGYVIFSAPSSGDSANLWRIALSPKTWRVTGTPQRLTSGTTLEKKPVVAMGKRIAFASLSENMDIWSLPVDVNRGKVIGELQRLTQDAGRDYVPAVSADGKKIVFLSDRLGNLDIWIRDLGRKEETALTVTASAEGSASISPDGSTVAYSTPEDQKRPIYTASTRGGPPEKVCEDCGRPCGWSSDGKRILYTHSTSRVSWLDLITGEKNPVLDHRTYGIYEPHFSPDNRWITFIATITTRSHVYIVPARLGQVLPESEWTAVTEGPSWNDSPRWSPDGKLLYFTSERDGFTCIWAQQLDAVTKRPIGTPFPVYHSHSSRRSLMNVGRGSLEISVARDKIVFNMAESVGNIWMANIER